MKQFVAYFRVSTQKQGNSGLGLGAQENTVKEHLSICGGELLESFTEIQSGSDNDRPQLQRALRKCRLTGATLLIAKLDRLSRNRAFLFQLMDSSISFECADMPEANSLTVGLMACLADYERQVISERTKLALKEAKKRGVVLGNPKLNEVRYTDTTNATKARMDKATQRNAEMLEVINEFKNEGGTLLSLRQIAKSLNDAGYKTARGNEFKGTTVQRILRSA